MKTIHLYVSLEIPFAELVRLAVMLREGGYRIGEPVFEETTAMIPFNRMGVNERDEETAPA
jgi:hypothetical protein